MVERNVGDILYEPALLVNGIVPLGDFASLSVLSQKYEFDHAFEACWWEDGDPQGKQRTAKV